MSLFNLYISASSTLSGYEFLLHYWKKLCPWIFVLDNTAVILTNRTGFSLQEEPVFYVSILIADNGIPSLTSTNTLTIHVCDCGDADLTQTCSHKDFMLSMGFRAEVITAILICIMIIFGKSCELSIYSFIDSMIHIEKSEFHYNDIMSTCVWVCAYLCVCLIALLNWPFTDQLIWIDLLNVTILKSGGVNEK